MQRFPLILLFWSLLSPALAQLGGQQGFAFLMLPATARQMALGGYHVSSSQNDASAWLSNAALLADSVDGQISTLYGGYYASSKQGTASYAHRFGSGTWGLGVRYLNYGEMQGYDATGAPTEPFKAADYAVSLGYGQKWGVYAGGAALKWVQSGIGSYRNTALVLDAGGAFIHPEKDLKIGISVKNLGFLISQTSSNLRLPTDIQAGISFKPQRMPLRFSLTAHHLYRFNISYEDQQSNGQVDPLGNPIDKKVNFSEKLASHFAFGGEFVLGKHFNVRLGYNMLDRKALALPKVPGTVGFSWGMMIHTNRFRVEFSRSNRFIGGGYSAIALSFSPKKTGLKRRVIE